MMQLMEHPITRYSGKDETEYQYISKVLKRFVSINDIADMDDESIELLIAEIKGKMAFLFNGDRLTARQAAYKARLTSFTARLKVNAKAGVRMLILNANGSHLKGVGLNMRNLSWQSKTKTGHSQFRQLNKLASTKFSSAC